MPSFNNLATIIAPSSLQRTECPSRLPVEVCQAMCIALLNASVHRFQRDEFEIAASWLHSASSFSPSCRELVRISERLEMELGHVRLAVDEEGLLDDDAANVAMPAPAADATALRHHQLGKLTALITETLAPRQGLAQLIYKGPALIPECAAAMARI